MNILAQELLKGSFGTVVKDLLGVAPYTDPLEPNLIYIDPSQHRTPDGDAWWLDQSGGNNYYFKYANYHSAVEAYNRCPPVSAVVNRKAQAFINGWTWVLNSRGKENTTSEPAKKMNSLLNRPNPLQSRKQFEAQGYIYQQLFGFNIILPVKPAGFTNLDATSLWNIPASWIDFDDTLEKFSRSGGASLTEITLKFNNTKVVLQIKDLIIIKDFTPSFGTLIFPGSKLGAMALPINNIIGAYESINTLIRFRGPSGILTSEPGSGQYVNIPMSPDEKNGLQADFRRYGLMKGQVQAILTTAAVKWQPIGSNVKDLQLHEEVREDTMAVCNGLNFPPFLLGLADTTFNNMNEAHKGLYQNSIIPDAENWAEQWTSAFGLSEFNLRLDKDFARVPVLQADKETSAKARKATNEARKIEWENGLITLNEWRIANEDDPLPDNRGTLYIDEYKKRYGTATTTNQENDGEGTEETEGSEAEAA
jgi:hypothetical protein